MSASSIKSVAITGASGSLGRPVLTALIESGKFNVTVLTRIGSSSTFPASVKVVPVDYSSVDSLTAALAGIDAVISTLGTPGLDSQIHLIDAAIAAGVSRFLPSEFGSDISNPKTSKLPVFQSKVKTQQYLEEKVKSTPTFSYTLVRNGSFLDWALPINVLLDFSSRQPPIYDGGDVQFSATTLASVGTAVTGVLTHPLETFNKAIYVQDLVTSQNQILALTRKLTPGQTWEPIPKDLAVLAAASDESLKKGEVTHHTFLPYILQSLMSEGYGGKFEKLDNELVGIKGKTEADLEALLKKILVAAN